MSLVFHVFGKRRDEDNPSDDFKIISTIELPFEEIFTVLKVRSFS